ncbi:MULTISPECIES: hypothetical protein [unclassified Serratia (in: enterobacteria)]|uniref:hypothetical protein n=1 Tax=unclassified Serratia (in: enterobacteria) TaxID=2647522 RepID=UPI002ED4E8E4|nr:hypothetical protein [Serratia sp. C2(2)]MEE4449342.1 hypothetical protein [Serratia sp. C2(1)]
MRELTIMEVDEVSGAGFFDTMGAGVLGAVTGSTNLMYKAAVSGGSTGGMLGVGIVSAGVGLIVGAVMGGIQGGLYGITNGWTKTLSLFNKSVEQWGDNTLPIPKV